MFRMQHNCARCALRCDCMMIAARIYALFNAAFSGVATNTVVTFATNGNGKYTMLACGDLNNVA